jgi:hypothetical protein
VNIDANVNGNGLILAVDLSKFKRLTCAHEPDTAAWPKSSETLRPAAASATWLA